MKKSDTTPALSRNQLWIFQQLPLAQGIYRQLRATTKTPWVIYMDQVRSKSLPNQNYVTNHQEPKHAPKRYCRYNVFFAKHPGTGNCHEEARTGINTNQIKISPPIYRTTAASSSQATITSRQRVWHYHIADGIGRPTLPARQTYLARMIMQIKRGNWEPTHPTAPFSNFLRSKSRWSVEASENRTPGRSYHYHS